VSIRDTEFRRCGLGIRVLLGHSRRIRVLDCKFRDFEDGLLVSGGERISVRRCDFRPPEIRSLCISLIEVNRGSVSRNVFREVGNAVYLSQSERLRVRRNRLETCAEARPVDASPNVVYVSRVRSCVIARNRLELTYSGQGELRGIELLGLCEDIVIRRNRISGTGTAGIVIGPDCLQTTLCRNSLEDGLPLIVDESVDPSEILECR